MRKKRRIVVSLNGSATLVVLIVLVALCLNSIDFLVREYSAFQIGDATGARIIFSTLSSLGWVCVLVCFLRLVWNEWRR